MACARYELDQDLVPNKVHVDSNMFGSLMMHRIRENIDCFCHGTILDFGTGADDGGLPFARPRNKIRANKYTIPRSRTASVGTATQSASKYAESIKEECER